MTREEFHMCSWPRSSVPAWAAVWMPAIGSMCLAGTRLLNRCRFDCLHLVLAGHVHYQVPDHHDGICAAGDCFVIRNGFSYRYFGPGGRDFSLLWLRLVGAGSSAYMDAMGFDDQCWQKRAEQPEELAALWGNLLRLCDSQDPAADWRMQELLAGIPPLVGLANANTDPPHRCELSDRAKQLIEQHFSDPDLNVSKLAQQLSIARNTLFLHCQRSWGCSPRSMLTHIRLSHARQLLRTTDLSLTAVAQASGYRHTPHFSRQFKAQFGIAPDHWRQQQRLAVLEAHHRWQANRPL